MGKSNNSLKASLAFCLILLQASNSWCQDLSPSAVKIYSKGVYLCEGTLVKPEYVVTSAECLVWQHDASVLTVVGNVIRDEATAADESSVTNIFKPQDYDKRTRYMDVAVLKLQKSIVGPKIKPAKLCSKNSIEEEELLTVYYWDLSGNKKVYKSDALLLRSLQLSVSDKTSCAKAYREKFFDTMFCAADPKRIDCFYGRGAPAAIDGEFCGFYNYGSTCIDKRWPASFTSLANPKIMQFINEALQN